MRHHERALPEVNDLVMARPVERDDDGAYFALELVEYADAPAHCRFKDMKRGRIRNPRTIAQLGKVECYCVMVVDGSNVDLSRVNVQHHEREAFELRFHRRKHLYDALGHLADKHSHSGLGDALGWPDPDGFFGLARGEFAGPFGDALRADLTKTSAALEAKERDDALAVSTVELKCFTPAGVNAIKQALAAGKTVHPAVRINLIAAPSYRVACARESRPVSEATVQAAIDAIFAEAARIGVEHKVGTASVAAAAAASEPA